MMSDILSDVDRESGSVTSKRIAIYPINFRFLVGDIKTDLAHTINLRKFTSPIVILVTEISVPVIIEGRLISL